MRGLAYGAVSCQHLENIFVLFVCVLILSHTRMFHSYEDLTTTGERIT